MPSGGEEKSSWISRPSRWITCGEKFSPPPWRAQAPEPPAAAADTEDDDDADDWAGAGTDTLLPTTPAAPPSSSIDSAAEDGLSPTRASGPPFICQHKAPVRHSEAL
jgi:hypothetical protein